MAELLYTDELQKERNNHLLLVSLEDTLWGLESPPPHCNYFPQLKNMISHMNSKSLKHMPLEPTNTGAFPTPLQ